MGRKRPLAQPAPDLLQRLSEPLVELHAFGVVDAPIAVIAALYEPEPAQRGFQTAAVRTCANQHLAGFEIVEDPKRQRPEHRGVNGNPSYTTETLTEPPRPVQS
jgi:hypothetical protein